MGELVYKPKRGEARTVVVTGVDGSSHEFTAGQAVDEEKVPEGVRAVLGDVKRDIAAPEPEQATEEPSGARKRGGN